MWESVGQDLFDRVMEEGDGMRPRLRKCGETARGRSRDVGADGYVCMIMKRKLECVWTTGQEGRQRTQDTTAAIRDNHKSQTGGSVGGGLEAFTSSATSLRLTGGG